MARTPHTCPTCSGEKQLNGAPCPTCEASGVVWEPEAGPQEAREVAGPDPQELTGL